MNYWAHRGLSRTFPENTLSAFEAACAYDITGIELDIHLTADGEPVVIHDSTVDRTTDGTGAVKDLTLEQIRALKIPAGLGTENAGRFEHVPALAEVLELCAPYCRDYGMMINIETKPDPEDPRGLEEKALEIVRSFGLERDVVWSSFDQKSLARLRELDPGCSIGILGKDAEKCLLAAKELGDGCALHPYMRSARENRAFIGTSRQFPVRVWTLQDQEPLFPDSAYAADGYQSGSEGPDVFNDAQLAAAAATDLITNNVDLYCKKRSFQVARRMIQAEIQALRNDCGIDPETGLLCPGFRSYATAEPISVSCGDVIEPILKDLSYRLFYYRAEPPVELILERGDQIEANRTAYSVCDEVFRFEPFTVEEDGFIRIVFDEANCGGGFTGTLSNASLEKLIRIRRAERPQPPKLTQAARAEILRFTDHVKAAAPDDILFLLGADTHYAFGGSWETTAQIMQILYRRMNFSAVIHLGDYTDGVLPPADTLHYARRVIEDLGASDLPMLFCLGDHDCSPFSVKTRTLSRKKGAGELYLGHQENFGTDFPEHRLRFIILNSYNPDDKEPFGFSSNTTMFFTQALKSAPKDHRIIVCSHVPPAAELMPGGQAVRNGAKMIAALEKHQSRYGNVLGWICGHTHADQVFRKYSFPIVTVGSMQVDYFRGEDGQATTGRKTPSGGVAPERVPGEASQELFDVLAVPKGRNELKFLRFGAGEDRTV